MSTEVVCCFAIGIAFIFIGVMLLAKPINTNFSVNGVTITTPVSTQFYTWEILEYYKEGVKKN